MSTNILNFSRPCNACRRRKVRCDKTNPCSNCVRHDITCTYDTRRETNVGVATTQLQLQERVERLEKIIEDASSQSSPNAGDRQRSIASSHPSPSAASWMGPISYEAPPSAAPPGDDAGVQLHEEHASYFVGSNFWLNLHSWNIDPRSLLRTDVHGLQASDQTSTWPLGMTGQHRLPSLSHLHLDQEMEDQLMELFFKHVEPFVRITHEKSWKQNLIEFRVGASQLEREVEATLFAMQAMVVSALPSQVWEEMTGHKKADLLRRFQTATELALDRADFLHSRRPQLFVALLYYIVSPLSLSLLILPQEIVS